MTMDDYWPSGRQANQTSVVKVQLIRPTTGSNMTIEVKVGVPLDKILKGLPGWKVLE